MSGTATLERDGYEIVAGVVPRERCEQWIERIDADVGARVGDRMLLSRPWCMELARELRASAAFNPRIGDAVAVQCTYFAKPAGAGWLVPLHQDRSIPVAARVDTSALTGWSIKQGMQFVHAPIGLLGRMVAVRLHLDPCGMEDGPLVVVPGSHPLGVIEPGTARTMRVREVACPADAGAVVLMRPLTLHRSSKPSGSSPRRVLHFLFGPPELPFGLRWQTAV